MQAPTQRQLSVLEFIQTFAARHQRPPTYRDIATRFAINPNAAKGHVLALEAKGMLRRERGHRAIACR